MLLKCLNLRAIILKARSLDELMERIKEAIQLCLVVSILKKAGFEIERQRGSHVFLRHSDGRATVVPIHQGETIGIGLLLKRRFL